MSGKEEEKNRCFIVTVGLSVITNYKKEKRCETIDKEKLLEHLVENYKVNPNKTSGELKTLKLLEFNPMIDLVYLLTTDTEEGNQAGQYIRDFLIKKLNTNENRVIHTPVPGLQVKDAARFLSEGALNLLSTIKRIKESNSPGHECIIISTGGFKSVFPVISDAGKIYQLNLKYVFESSNEVISLPPDRDKFYESLKERHHITLAKELIKARFDYTEFSSNCHPDSIDHIPYDTLYREEFDKKGGLESYKALYHICKDDLKRLKQDRYYFQQMQNRSIRIDILKKIFGKIILSTSLTDDDRITLPIAPGMLFIICVVEFCEEMGIDKVELTATEPGGQRARIIMKIQLKDPLRFKYGTMTGGGKGLELFRDLLACKSETLLNQASKEQREEIITNWPPRPMSEGIHGHTDIYPPIIDFEINENRGTLELWWHSNKNNGNMSEESRHTNSRGSIDFISQWNIKNRAFRHDWLQYFIEDIKAFIKTGCCDFTLVEQGFRHWEIQKKAEAKELIEQLETGLEKSGGKGHEKIEPAYRIIEAADVVYKKCSNQVLPGGEINIDDFKELQDVFIRLSRVFRNLEI